MVTGPWAEKLAELIPDAELCEIERGTHGLPLQAPEELAAAARGFLKG